MNIEELKRLAEAATPGPWEVCGNTVDQAWDAGGGEVIPCDVSCGAFCYGGSPVPAKESDLAYIAAANPAAVLELIAEVERWKYDAEATRVLLVESRKDDYQAMAWLADCRFAVGDDGKRMLPDFVEYLKTLKQQRDELLAALREIADWTERYTTPGHPISTVARAAIAKAEAAS